MCTTCSLKLKHALRSRAACSHKSRCLKLKHALCMRKARSLKLEHAFSMRTVRYVGQGHAFTPCGHVRQRRGSSRLLDEFIQIFAVALRSWKLLRFYGDPLVHAGASFNKIAAELANSSSRHVSLSAIIGSMTRSQCLLARYRSFVVFQRSHAYVTMLRTSLTVPSECFSRLSSSTTN